MIEQFLAREEGKTLEFKENSNSIDRIVHTVIHFSISSCFLLNMAFPGLSNASKSCK